MLKKKRLKHAGRAIKINGECRSGAEEEAIETYIHIGNAGNACRSGAEEEAIETLALRREDAFFSADQVLKKKRLKRWMPNWAAITRSADQVLKKKRLKPPEKGV